jgi:hypothetical protein
MRRSLRLALLATTVTTGVLVRPAVAKADEQPAAAVTEPTVPTHDADVEEARALFLRGVALAQASDWEDARSAFERSNQLRPHAVTLYNVAFCEQALGLYTRAARDFGAALEDGNAPGESRLPPELEAMARRDLGKIESELSTAVVVVRDRSDRLLVDGRPLKPAGTHEGRPVLLAGARDPGPPELVPATTLEIRLDPGSHVFRLVHHDGVPRDLARTLRPSETALVELYVPEPKPPAPATSDAASAGSSKRVVAYWAIGGAAAGAVFAGVFGTLALVQRSELANSCSGGVCGPNHASDVSRLGVYSDLTTGGIAVAAAGLALGGFLLVTSSSPRSAAQARSPHRVEVRLRFGAPGSVSVDGVF